MHTSRYRMFQMIFGSFGRGDRNFLGSRGRTAKPIRPLDERRSGMTDWHPWDAEHRRRGHDPDRPHEESGYGHDDPYRHPDSADPQRQADGRQLGDLPWQERPWGGTVSSETAPLHSGPVHTGPVHTGYPDGPAHEPTARGTTYRAATPMAEPDLEYDDASEGRSPRGRRAAVAGVALGGLAVAAAAVPPVRHALLGLFDSDAAPTAAEERSDLPVPVTSEPPASGAPEAPRREGPVPDSFTDRDSSYSMSKPRKKGKPNKQPKWPSKQDKSPELAAQNAQPAATTPLSHDPLQHLLARFTFGASPTDVAELRRGGVLRWLHRQLNTAKPGYTGAPASVMPLLSKSPRQLIDAVAAKQIGSSDAMNQLTYATFACQLWSPYQLYERMVDFWANHLSVANHDGDQYPYRHTFDRDVIRPHALGKFSDMLLASSKNPSMLKYLNQNESRKESVNENYGREILELHTLGYGGGYTETDVRQTSYIFTGRTISGTTREYIFDPKRHYVGPVSAVGFKHENKTAEGGEAVGDAFVRHLALLPATAKFICRKLCVRFVSDVPPQALVDRLAKVYLRHGSAIKPVLWTLFLSYEFWASRGQKTRRPGENVVATARALDVKPGADPKKGLNSLYGVTRAMGHSPLDWQPPNGYPDVANAWVSAGTMLRLWGAHRALAQGTYQGFGYGPLAKLYDVRARTAGAVVDSLAMRLLGQRLRASDREAMLAFLGAEADTPVSSVDVAGKLPHLVPLFFDSVYHALR